MDQRSVARRQPVRNQRGQLFHIAAGAFGLREPALPGGVGARVAHGKYRQIAPFRRRRQRPRAIRAGNQDRLNI